MRLIQLSSGKERRVAKVEEPLLHLLDGCASVYELAQSCITHERGVGAEVAARLSDVTLDYGEVWEGTSAWKILPSIDHPGEPARCLVTGTGLTHMASAKNRQAMHAREEELTDSMRMYRWGVEGGKPPAVMEGTAPEWFYKGPGGILRGHLEPLSIPAWADDGGEEPEVVAVYLIGPDGTPWRIGFTQGNEFSDHELERRNYLYLAASKLRNCAIGPELVVGAEFRTVPGAVAIEREGRTVWQRTITSGEEVMSHSLANLEHHHFKFDAHRRPGDVHVHFLGADAFSFGEGVRLQDGDVMQVQFDGFGRALRNRLRRVPREHNVVQVRALEE